MSTDTLIFDSQSLQLNPLRALSRGMIHFNGKDSLTRFPRVLAEVLDQGGELEWHLLLAPHPRGSALLDLQIKGSVNLTCVECRQAVRHSFHLSSKLLWCLDAARAQEIEEDGIEEIEQLEVITSDIGLGEHSAEVLDVQALIEDDVLLNLPHSARHKECARAKKIIASPLPDSSHQPFAGLKDLLKKN